MPANLTPQYREVERKYREATSLAARIAALQEMMAVIPKHKGTDHLRGELRARMAKHMEEMEKPRAGGPGSGGPQPFNIRKEGAGQVLLIGLTTSGKSELLNALTGAPAKTGDYRFTTQVPMVGMLPFENVNIQLIDTPSLDYKDIQSQLFGLLRQSDYVLVVLDLSKDPVKELEEVMGVLDQWGFALLEKGQSLDEDAAKVQKPATLLANKADMDEDGARFQALESACGSRFPILRASCLDGAGLGVMGREVFQALGKIRVYTKPPSGKPSMDDPMVVPVGSTVADAAERLHKDWRDKLKYALLWGSAKFEGQRVGREYVLFDGDVMELHG
ncbi:MAG: TGS domain-containing protein [SAR202 cluster bacterium]|nr:TGS domain-containing protein [SAR202 cluster bacterium]